MEGGQITQASLFPFLFASLTLTALWLTSSRKFEGRNPGTVPSPFSVHPTPFPPRPCSGHVVY
ncbi:hypothetical protein LX36DRAFT_659878 [Colletotrichum falcatum]|nr:hypothetical protein LX36DRAFT_659878 [Colletotrichum falcatum]